MGYSTSSDERVVFRHDRSAADKCEHRWLREHQAETIRELMVAAQEAKSVLRKWQP